MEMYSEIFTIHRTFCRKVLPVGPKTICRIIQFTTGAVKKHHFREVCCIFCFLVRWATRKGFWPGTHCNWRDGVPNPDYVSLICARQMFYTDIEQARLSAELLLALYSFLPHTSICISLFIGLSTYVVPYNFCINMHSVYFLCDDCFYFFKRVLE